MLTTKEYMEKYNIKSKQTIYNHEKEGRIRILKNGNRISIIENGTSIDTDSIKDEETKNTILELNKKIELLEKEIEDLKNNNAKLNLDLENNNTKLHLELKNKDLQIESKDKFIENLENTIKNENIRYNMLIQQMNETTKTYQLLLEHKKDKKWYQVWK